MCQTRHTLILVTRTVHLKQNYGFFLIVSVLITNGILEKDALFENLNDSAKKRFNVRFVPSKANSTKVMLQPVFHHKEDMG